MVKPLGIINRPNQYGVIPAGAMLDARQVTLRKAGTLRPAASMVQWTTTTADSNTLNFLAPTDAIGTTDQRLLAIYTTTGPAGRMRWVDNTGTFTGVENYTDPEIGLNLIQVANRPFSFKHRNRLFVMSDKGVGVHDFLQPSSATERAPRITEGLGQTAVIAINTAAASNGPYAAAGAIAAYRVVRRRVFSDGYTVVGRPTPARLFANLGAQANAQVQFFMPTYNAARGKTYVDIYRTYIRSAGTDPGATFYLVGSIESTAANTAALTNYVDALANTALGPELYTNPGIEGAAQSNFGPPICQTMATYKGFAFYGNITVPPRANLGAPIPDSGVLPAGSSLRTTGIGLRQGTGTSASGSAVITAVSAADMVGIAIGQLFSHAGFAANRTVTAVGVSTITVDGLAASSTTTTFFAYDMLYVKRWSSDSYQSMTTLIGDQTNLTIVNPFDVFVETNHVANLSNSGLSYAGITALYGIKYVQVSPTDSRLEFLATNGANWTPQIPSVPSFPIPQPSVGLRFDPTSQPNGFQWSKDQLPEACPPINVGFAGSGTILKIESTRDALYFFCTDGIFRLSGSGGQWRLDPLDSTTIIVGPKCTGVLRDNVYAYTNIGLVRISSDQALQKISEPILNEMQGSPYAEDQATMLLCDESNNEVWVSFSPATAGANGRWRVYNADTGTFVTFDMPTTGVQAACYTRQGKLPTIAQEGCLEFMGPNAGATGHIVRHQPTVPTAYEVPVCNFQPLFGKRADIMKQWIRAVHLLTYTGTDPTLQPIWNEIAPSSGALTPTGPALGQDKRALAWTPRDVAISPTIKVGFSLATVPASSDVEYLGFVIEYNELTTQPRAR